MRKKLFTILAVAIMVAFGACSNEELLSDSKSDAKQENVRTLSLTASMPVEPTPRVGLEQKEDKSIALTWEVGDKLQLAFVQGTTKVKRTDTLTIGNITNEGKNAQFNIVIPDEIIDGTPFDLYGVYGGGRRVLNVGVELPGSTGSGGEVGIKNYYSGDALELGDENTNPYIKLPSNTAIATSLSGDDGGSVKNRKDVMLYFSSTGIDATKSNVAVMFQHLGSLFSITLKNTCTTSLDNLQGAQLVGVDAAGNPLTDGKWAYNSVEGGQTYDLVASTFQNPASAGNYISFKAVENILPAGETITFWAWYPPLPDKVWPALQLQLKNETTIPMAISINSKPARTEATAVGKSYYFYAEWNGSDLNFTDAI